MFERRRPEAARIDISSLVDVVFLLLIFFMVTTRFAEEQVVQIELPSADGEGRQVESEMPRLSVDAGDRIWLGDEQVARVELLPRLEQLLDGRSADERTLVLSADQQATWEVMAHVFDAMGKAGATTVIAPTDPDASAP